MLSLKLLDYILILKNKMEQDDYLFPKELSKFDEFMRDKRPLSPGVTSYEYHPVKYSSNFLEYEISDSVRRARNWDIFIRTRRLLNDSLE